MELLSLLLFCLIWISHANSVTFVLGCGRYPGPCNNKCYATFVAGRPNNFIWNRPTAQQRAANRVASGASPNPCGVHIAAPPACTHPDGHAVACNSPDEYPYAASTIGGAGAVLRCTGADENFLEGSELGTIITTRVTDGGCGSVAPCAINIAFSFVGADA